MHSFEMVNFHDVVSKSLYDKHIFVSAINKGNLYGVQFRPEKSCVAGLQQLRNFLEI